MLCQTQCSCRPQNHPLPMKCHTRGRLPLPNMLAGHANGVASCRWGPHVHSKYLFGAIEKAWGHFRRPAQIPEFGHESSYFKTRLKTNHIISSCGSRNCCLRLAFEGLHEEIYRLHKPTGPCVSCMHARCTSVFYTHT